MRAHLDYRSLAESPLVYKTEKPKDMNLKYQIIESCNQLRYDFNGDRYWKK